jgi:hypothetical protein
MQHFHPWRVQAKIFDFVKVTARSEAIRRPSLRAKRSNPAPVIASEAKQSKRIFSSVRCIVKKTIAAILILISSMCVFSGCYVTVLSAPANVKAEASGYYAARVSWSGVAKADAYAVAWREVASESPDINELAPDADNGAASGAASDADTDKDAAAGGSLASGVAEVSETTLVIEGLAVDTDYAITVSALQAKDGGRAGIASAPVLVRTETPVVETPYGVAAKVVYGQGIKAMWEDISLPGELKNAELYYTVYGADSEDANPVLLADHVYGTDYTENGIPPATQRYYCVSAVIATDGRAFTSAVSERVGALVGEEKADEGNLVPGGPAGGALVDGGFTDGAGGGTFEFEGDARVYMAFRSWCSCGWEESFEDAVTSSEEGQANYDLAKQLAQAHREETFGYGDFSHQVNWGYREL